MDISISDFLNSAKEAFREYERIQKEVGLLTIRCRKLEKTGEAYEIKTEFDWVHQKIVRSSQSEATLAILKDRLAAERFRELDALRNALSQSRAIAEFIEFLPYSEMRIVMRYRYLEDLTWEGISSRLALDGWQITARHIWTIHSRAMIVAQELWDSLYQKEEKREVGGE